MRITVGRVGKRMAIALAALLVLGFGVGTLTNRSARLKESLMVAGQSEATTTSAAPGNGGATYDAQLAVKHAAAGGGSAFAPAAPEPDAGVALPLPQQIIKTGELSVEVKRGSFGSAWDSVFRLATRYHGYVAASTRGDGGPKPVPVEGDAAVKSSGTPAFGDITIRVPSSNFDAALRDLRAYGAVKTDNVSTEDVTQQVVDLDARLRNSRAQESLLLKFLNQAKNVGESLNVQRTLNSTQQEIEQLEGQQRQLKAQTSLATISLHLTEPGAVAAARDDLTGPSFARAWHTASVGLLRIATVAMIGALWLVPFAILGLIALVFVRRIKVQPQA